MSPGFIVAFLLLAALVAWIAFSFYWLRVLACGMLLLVWGLVGILAPLYMAADTLLSGQFVRGLGILLVFTVTGTLWILAFFQARDWYRRTRKVGFFNKRWNAR